jgi:hypothetical protein
MTNSSIAIATDLQEGDQIEVHRGMIKIASVLFCKVKDVQLLDLGMKIQSVINQIDRENRVSNTADLDCKYCGSTHGDTHESNCTRPR